MKRRDWGWVRRTALAAGTLLLAATGAPAALKVNVMPSGVASPVNTWDSRPYTWPGNPLELWGNVSYTGSQVLSYTWTFGAGEGSAGGTVGTRSNIAVTHTYAGTGNYVATLTVTDGTETDTDTVYIDVVPDSPAVRTNLAIQRGLKYLYMKRLTWSVNGCSTYYWDDTRWTGDTGLAVLAFEDHGHREMNDHDKDIYAETVEKGLDAIFAMLRATTGATNNAPYDSDLNGNGRRVYEGNTNNMYEQGILAMALANTAAPDMQASCGDANITGQSYKTLLEDMVDQIAFAQKDTGSGLGGWRYTPNYGDSDNSVSQWPALGLAAAAGAPWAITDTNPTYPSYPAWVKSRMQTWLNYSQCGSSGGFGYNSPCYWPNIAKTGSGIIARTVAGGGGNLTNAVNFIANNWNSTTGDYGNLGDHYAMYAVKKGLQYAGLSTVGGHEWQKEYNAWYVGHKIDNGTNGWYWPSSIRITAGRTTASFALLVMAPGLVELPPVADAGIDQQVPPGVAVTLDGRASHHTDPARHIVSYDWDFDYDGTNFTPDASGQIVTNLAGYISPAPAASKNYTVALRVTDDSVPPRTATDTAILTVSVNNVAPVADAGGPYIGAVNGIITLDGTGSFDNNAAGGPNPIPVPANASGFDEIKAYKWDMDGDGRYGTEDTPAEPEGATVDVTFSTIGTRTIGLKVIDSFAVSAAQSSNLTTVAVSDLQPLCYQNTVNSYNPVTRKWTVGWKLKLKNQGNAAASLVTAALTGSSLPAGVTVLDGSLAWPGFIDAGASVLSGDDFRYTYLRGATGPDLAKITWDIQYSDALGVQHVVRNIPQGSGICQ